MTASTRMVVFIDGPNLDATVRALGFDVDYKKLLSICERGGSLLKAFYYTLLFEDPLANWLACNGYTVMTKATKEFVDSSGRRKMKGRIGIEIAVSAMEYAARADEMVLFSGDGGFRSLVEAVQRRGVRVTVVSTIKSRTSMVADELRRQADVFQDLDEMRALIGRDQSATSASKTRVEIAGR